MSNNHFSDLEIFAAVVETGSFTAAARRLERSKAAVSRQIHGLEERLGTLLLHRTTRALSLTGAGAALYERTVGPLADLRDAEAAVSSLQSSPRGRLRVSLPVAYGRLVAAPALLALAEENPGLELDLSFSDRFVDLVGEGLDLAVRIGELSDSSLVARRLGDARRMVCAAPAYLARRGVPQRPADLAVHDGLLYAHQTHGPAWRFAGGVAVQVRGRVRSDSGDALRAAALAGLGVAWLPDFYVAADLAAGRLVAVLEEHRAEPLGVWAVYPHRRHLSAKVRLAVDRLAEAAAAAPATERPVC